MVLPRIGKRGPFALVSLEGNRELRERAISVKEERKGTVGHFFCVLSPSVSNLGIFFLLVFAIVLHV